MHAMERDDQMALTEEAEIDGEEDEEGDDEKVDSGEEEGESSDPVRIAWKHDFRGVNKRAGRRQSTVGVPVK